MKSLFFALLAGTAAAAEPPTLKVGLDPRAAPWVFAPGYDYSRQAYDQKPELTRGQLSRLVGLDVDILRALERRLGVRFEIVQTRWIDLERDLLASRYDLILNAWTPNAATPPGIAATDAYHPWGLLVAARSDDEAIRSISDLGERRLGHISDPTVIAALSAMSNSLGAKRVVVDQGGDELFRQLGRGELDAVVFDSAYVRWRVARDHAFRVVGEPLNQLGYHVGVRSQDRELLARLQAAIRDLVESAEAVQIRAKWESAGTPAP